MSFENVLPKLKKLDEDLEADKLHPSAWFVASMAVIMAEYIRETGDVELVKLQDGLKMGR